jgi:nucleoside phosphorylase
MQATFPNVRFSLMVGIGGGIPSPPGTDIRLGDIVVSIPSEQGPGVIQYDLGRVTVNEFVRKGTLSKPPGLLLAAVNDLRSRSGVAKGLSEMLSKAGQIEDEEGDLHEQNYPTDLVDTLFQPDYDHLALGPCDCERKTPEANGNAITRKKRSHQNPRIHYGNIASGSAVMKNARERDALAKRDNVICFEMEAFGLMDDFQCLVIRGICDYSDSHKNKEWQPYASSVAAAYAKRLLRVIPPEEVAKLKPVRSE